MRAERIGHVRQRPLHVSDERFRIGDVVRNFAHAVHVVGHTDDFGGDLVVGQHAEGMAHHRGAHDFPEGADMRQAARAVAGFEHHHVLRMALMPLEHEARLFEGPSFGGGGEGGKIGHQANPSRELA